MKYRITWVFRPYSINGSHEISYEDWSEALLYETGIHSDAYALVNAKLTLNSQDEATFSFVMPPSHEHYDRIEARVGYIIFWQDGEIICKGRIDSITVDLNGAKNVSGFGNLGLLKEALISQSARKWVGTYDHSVYTSPTRSSPFAAFRKSDNVKTKVQRILSIANGQLCDQQMTGYNPDFSTDQWQRDKYTTIWLGNCDAKENVNGINISNTNSSGGAQEGIYINAKYETFDTAFDWFKDELIAKTNCQIECSFIPLAGDSAPKPPYAMTLNIFGREGVVRTTAVFRKGWNVLDYKFSENRGDDFCTVLIPFGDEDSRMSSTVTDAGTKTGYEETIDSKMTLEKDSSDSGYVQTNFKFVSVNQEFVQQLADANPPSRVFVLYRRWYDSTVLSTINARDTMFGVEKPVVFSDDPTPTTAAMKIQTMDGYRAYKVYSDSEVEPYFPIVYNDNNGRYESWWSNGWPPAMNAVNADGLKEHWAPFTPAETAAYVIENNYSFPQSPDAQISPLAINVANGMTFAIKPPYLVWVEGLAKYGPIVAKEDFSTKSRVAILNYGIDALRTRIANSYELTIRAIDPHLIDENYASARVASRVPIMLPEYEGEMVICTKTIDISNPGNCLIEFNKKPAYLVDIVKENAALIKRAYAAKRYTRIMNGELVPQEDGRQPRT